MAGEMTLTQKAEMVSGAASAVMARAKQLEKLLGRAPIEKEAGYPERAVGGPGDIIENATDDLRRVEHILDALIAYVGQPGEGMVDGGSIGSARSDPRVTPRYG
jgi:hypothetical protein